MPFLPTKSCRVAIFAARRGGTASNMSAKIEAETENVLISTGTAKYTDLAARQAKIAGFCFKLHHLRRNAYIFKVTEDSPRYNQLAQTHVVSSHQMAELLRSNRRFGCNCYGAPAIHGAGWMTSL